jgi:cellobiose-specific phosphotransferase system component IIC
LLLCGVAIFLFEAALLTILNRVDAKPQFGLGGPCKSCIRYTVFVSNLWIVGLHGHY